MRAMGIIIRSILLMALSMVALTRMEREIQMLGERIRIHFLIKIILM